MISFGSAPGNLMNVLGKVALVIKQMRTYQNAQETNLVDPSVGLVAQLNANPDIQALVGSSYIGILNNAGTVGNTMQSIAQKVANRYVYLDNPSVNQSLTGGDVTASLQEIVRQMKLAGATVLAMTVTATPSTFTGTGNGVLVASVRRPSDGVILENAYAETLKISCIGDSYSGGASEGNESFSVAGGSPQTNPFAFNWPQGSGSGSTLSAINGNASLSQGNMLTNSGFEDWTLSVPDSWTLVVGTAGIHVFEETSLVYDGNAALKLVGDGSNLTQIKQALTQLSPSTQYGVNLFIRRDAVSAAAGVLTVDLTNDVGGVLQDNAGNNCSFTASLIGLTTVYASYSGAFRTPVILPSTVYIRLRLSTALTTGRAVYIDKLSMGQMTQLYATGPYLSAHAGSTPFVVGDYASLVVTNSRGVAGTLDTFQTVFARLFPSTMLSSGLLLPSSSTPTLVDAAYIA